MIYLKFVGRPDSEPLHQEYMTSCQEFEKRRGDDYIDVVFNNVFERLETGHWHTCYVMSETGKTIDVIHAPK